ncbi:MAG: hypothetical protein KDK33_06465 [Leptospiraceae bacterium]|nr:hypothetical protein [Leptospiraceae bacterium]
MSVTFCLFAGCRVLEPIHYVYTPESYLTADSQSTADSGESSNPALQLTDGRGTSIRFLARGPLQVAETKSHSASNPESETIGIDSSQVDDSGNDDKFSEDEGKPAWIQTLTIVNEDLARKLFVSSRDYKEGRLPDELFLELRVTNRSGAPLLVHPYAASLRCDGVTRHPLEPRAYFDRDYSLATSWLSFRWHMMPRLLAFFFRVDPSGDYQFNQERFSENQRQKYIRQTLDTWRQPDRITVESDQTVMLYLAFEQFDGSIKHRHCTLQSEVIPGASSQWSFSLIRTSQSRFEQWEDEKQSPLRSADRPKFLSERFALQQRAERELESLQKMHKENRQQFCKNRPEEQRPAFCNDAFWYRWLGSGFD